MKKIIGGIIALAWGTMNVFAQGAGGCVADLEVLKEGNQRFYASRMIFPHQDTVTLRQLSAGQNPFAVVVCCSDSRVSPEVIFDQGLGDLFVIRTAGNVMGDLEVGSVEYAVEHLNTRLIIVLGHTSCGAIKAYLEASAASPDEHGAPTGYVQSILDKLGGEEEMVEVFRTDGDHYHDAICANVKHGVKQLKESDPVLSAFFKEGKIEIVGAVYDITAGRVSFLDR